MSYLDQRRQEIEGGEPTDAIPNEPYGPNLVRRRVAVTFTIEVWVPNDWDDSQVQFQYEENFCTDNFVNYLARWQLVHKGTCATCWFANVKVLPLTALASGYGARK